jgi:toxin ParE1/3/4
MSGHARRTHAAERDLADQAEFLAKQSPAVAIRFLEAAEETFGLLAGMPEIGSPTQVKNPRLTDLRIWKIKGFNNHLVLYRPVDDGIEIVRVVHATRDMRGIFGA